MVQQLYALDGAILVKENYFFIVIFLTGYINPSLTHTELNSTTTTSSSREGHHHNTGTTQSIGKSKSTTATSKQIPSTPPPSYEHVLEEVRVL